MGVLIFMLNFANVAFSIHGSDSFMLVCTAASWCKIDPKHKTGYIIQYLSHNNGFNTL